MKPETYTRARTVIMSDILSFYITRDWQRPDTPGNLSPSIKGFTPTNFSSDHVVVVGDLVILSSAPPSKWSIGWLRAIERRSDNFLYYLIESLEDGEQMWWTNVGLAFMPRENIRERYRWSDKQFEFNSRWYNLTKNAGPGVRLLDCSFATTGPGVTFRLRKCWSDGAEPITRSFGDYRKVTKAMMLAAIESMSEELSKAER